MNRWSLLRGRGTTVHAGAGHLVFEKFDINSSQMKHTIGPAKISGGGGLGGGVCTSWSAAYRCVNKNDEKGYFFQTGQCVVLVPTSFLCNCNI